MTKGNEFGSISIAAPAAVIFDIVSDPRQHSRIDGSGTVQDVVTGPARLELGSTFSIRMKRGAPYRMANKVVEFEQDRLIAWRHIGVHRWRYELDPQADGTTTVTETWDLADYGKLAAAALAKLFGAKTKQAITATLVNLKTAAEADASAR